MQWFSQFSKSLPASRGAFFTMVTKDGTPSRIFYLAADEALYAHDGEAEMLPLRFYRAGPEYEARLRGINPQVQPVHLLPDPQKAPRLIALVKNVTNETLVWMHLALISALSAPRAS